MCACSHTHTTYRHTPTHIHARERARAHTHTHVLIESLPALTKSICFLRSSSIFCLCRSAISCLFLKASATRSSFVKNFGWKQNNTEQFAGETITCHPSNKIWSKKYPDQAGKDDFIHLLSGLDHVAFERQEEVNAWFLSHEWKNIRLLKPTTTEQIRSP